MNRQPRSAKAVATRQRILQAAGRLFRRDGIEPTGIDAIMREAKLTVGGFYSHFDSKESLLVASLEAALAESKARLRQAMASTPADPMAGLVGVYLSEAHREHPDRGCALAALASEFSRAKIKALSPMVGRYLEEWLAILGASAQGDRREKTLQDIAAVVGCLLLSRMTRGHALSDEFLRAGRRRSRSGIN